MSSSRLSLVFPTAAHERAAWAYRQAHFDAGEQGIHGSGGLYRAANYADWLAKITNALTASRTGWVNCSTFFAVVDGEIVGTLQIRHALNEALARVGGHIGYGVAPAHRRRGYATAMLTQALPMCRALGLTRVLITCDKSNAASARTAMRCGGALEDEIIEENGNIVQRYWIGLGDEGAV